MIPDGYIELTSTLHLTPTRVKVSKISYYNHVNKETTNSTLIVFDGGTKLYVKESVDTVDHTIKMYQLAHKIGAR